MPRKSRQKQPESPAGLSTEEYAKPGEPILEAPDYKLAKYDPPERPAAQIKTSKAFTGRIASGRGRVVEAHDGDYSIEAFKNPLNGPEVALAQRNGLDVLSEDGEAVTLMAGEKKAVRECNGDINWVARAVTGKDAGRER